MTSVTENDLKKLEDLITNSQRAIETRLTTIETDFKIGMTEIKGEIKALDAKINGLSERIKPIDKIPDLSEKVGELKNWKQVGIVVITALISSVLSGSIGGVIGWLIRSAKI